MTIKNKKNQVLDRRLILYLYIDIFLKNISSYTHYSKIKNNPF